MTVADLVHVNAVLNAVATIFLICGYRFIRTGRIAEHRLCMISAAVTSGLFLISYLIYHANAGLARFGGEGMARPIYFGILIVHVIAAAVITPLVPITLWRALRGRFDSHRKIARWTWPIWVYVSVSGVVVYLLSVHVFPYSAAGNAAG